MDFNSDQLPQAIVEFRQAVSATAKVPVIFIDPNVFRKLGGPTERPKLDDQLERQKPGSSKMFSESDKDDLISQALLSKGPFAFNIYSEDQTTGFVVQPNKNLRTKEAVGQIYSGIPEHRLMLPGALSDYLSIIGAHEGQHLNPVEPNLAYTEDKQKIKAMFLERETEADEASWKWGNKNGKAAVVDAVKDLRVLTLMTDDIKHVTGPVINAGLKPDDEAINAAESFQTDVLGGLNACRGKDNALKTENIPAVQYKSPELFYGVVKALSESGHYDNDPVKKSFAWQYIKAYETRVKPVAMDVTYDPQAPKSCKYVGFPVKFQP